MNRTPDRTTRSRPGAEPIELADLRGWLRDAKRNLTFYSLARRARGDGRSEYEISECTLRQALDGRLPTLKTTLAFARGAGADQKKAERLWRAADRAVNPPPRRPAPHVPGAFTTPDGLVRAMNRVRATAPHTSLRALADRAGTGLSRSTLHRLLAGDQMPTTGQLTAFAAACDASAEAAAALLAGHHRILNGPDRPFPHPCAEAEWAAERRYRDEAARPWLAEPELGWDDQQLLDEEEADFRHRVADAEDLLDGLEADLPQGPSGRSPAADRRRTGLAAIAARAQPVYGAWIGRPPAPDRAGPNQP